MHRDKKATFLAMTDANDVGPAGQWIAVAHCSAVQACGRRVAGGGQRARQRVLSD